MAAREEFPRHPERRFEGGGLVSVVAVVQEDAGGRPGDDPVRLLVGEPAWVGEPPGIAPDLLEPREVFGSADGERDQFPMLEGLAKDRDADALRTFDGGEIAVEPAVVGHRAAHRVSENLFRRGNLRAGGRREERRHENGGRRRTRHEKRLPNRPQQAVPARHDPRYLSAPMERRRFTALAAGSALALLWQQACAEVEETGEVSAATANTLLDHQGPRGIYEDPAELERLRRAIGNMVEVQRTLREFPLDPDEPPLPVFRRG